MARESICRIQAHRILKLRCGVHQEAKHQAMVTPPSLRSHRRLLEDSVNQTSDDLFYSGRGGGGGGGDVVGFDSNMVIVLAALLCALLCVVGINTIIRCAIRCGYIFAPFDQASSSRNHDREPDHVARTGLKKSTLSQIPVVVYGSSSGVDIIPATDCPICLGEYEQGEKLRILPECKHGFHVQCIDTWFLSHTSCPLCRQFPYKDHQQPESTCIL